MKGKLLCMAVLLTALWAAAAWAEPAPFGLELRKTTLKEVKRRFHLKYTGTSPKYGWSYYDIDKWDLRKLNFEGLKGIELTFSKKGELLSVRCFFVSVKTKEIFEMLKEKYRLVLAKGNPDEPCCFSALFDGGNKVRIVLNKDYKPHARLLYICEEHSHMLHEVVNEYKTEQRKREKDLL